MSNYKITPEPTIRRLPKYVHFLQSLKEKKITTVSSTTIAEGLGLDSTLVRKDIEVTGIVGKPKTGFYIDDLIFYIKEHLNWNNLEDAFLIGAGSLGSALVGYDGFKQYGLNIIAAFDTASEKMGTELKGIPILHIDKLEELCKRMHILIGVITVPSHAAQDVANSLVRGGVKAIWNFSPRQIVTPDYVIVEHAQLSMSLAVLKRKLREADLIDEKITELK